MVALPVDSSASEFVYALTGSINTVVGWQVFDDSKKTRMAFHRDGGQAEVEPEMLRMNARGFGVFVYVNELDGAGHEEVNVKSLRALFVDSDNGPLPELPLPPSFVVDSGHGEHGYWLLKPGEAIEDFRPAQRALAARLGTDQTVCNPNRVMRCPGFDHCKAEPYRVGLRVNDLGTRYTIADVLSGIGCGEVCRPCAESAIAVEADDSDLEERKARYVAYLGGMGPAVEGHGGDAHTVKAAMAAGDFGLSAKDALPALLVWDKDNEPPWGEDGIRSKIKNAEKYRKKPSGCKLDPGDVDLSAFRMPGPEPTPMEVHSLSEMLPPSAPTPRRSLAELMRCAPGVVGELAEWMNERAIKRQPVLALGASLAACSAIIGRKAISETQLSPNLYVLGIAHTGSGKERPRQVIGQLFTDIGIAGRIGDSFASGAAVETAMKASIESIYLIDEIGDLLGLIKDQGSPAYLKDISTVFKKMYSASEGFYRPRTRANAEENDSTVLVRPFLSVYGTTVPSNLYGASLGREQIATGLLSRFVAFESDDPDPYRQIPSRASRETPSRIKAWGQMWAEDKGLGGDMEQHEKDRLVPRELCYGKGTRAVFDQLELDFRARRDWCREHKQNDAAYSRGEALGIKLALVVACAQGHSQIEEDDARWGADLSWVQTTTFVAKVEDHLADNKTEADSKSLERLIEAAGAAGMTKSEIVNDTRSMKAHERNDLMASLVQAGRVIESKERRHATGPEAKVYKVRRFAA